MQTAETFHTPVAQELASMQIPPLDDLPFLGINEIILILHSLPSVAINGGTKE
jgi:hypothetical protein